MSTDRLQLKLLTPVKTLFDQPVDQVVVNTQDGEITVLPNHSQLVSILMAGELLIKDGDKEFPLAVSFGTLEISNNTLVILADAADHAHDIDVEASEKKAAELAKELETQEEMDITTYNNLQRLLQKERAKLAVGKKWRS
ncbi:MAG: ATP synthase F1 subunit epsilon [Candidatus Kerfeldbacteria bacterium CG15_BIG_FIL_POST_REV_8_21_14_020_45_12]|uniref:ATP synthase epsilon chain n=1 Tax=Candidatus Kerfeldbacteria bacterium CG15_BIG_FIL_POST_REV_8_21_14_020_45_12 TaxID=2014247 RepID=A0A2M7H4I5_9BACT|nr:MAG: ATP synthase F1 subunit epsilon [Candidatus Kerfeldbacteria bacterium CG15_BIG_FIL_POST_REV_8_21_14_020_45_12]PJA92935.1 MAG: ATP synthase F1 subunit epsilon [Candidatus Kerfeldbacteria bacterium CG_4_9_14_3_um_filter_45_8]